MKLTIKCSTDVLVICYPLSNFLKFSVSRRTLNYLLAGVGGQPLPDNVTGTYSA